MKAAIARGEVPADRDPVREATLLIALTEGLSSEVLMETYPPQDALALVEEHLARLFSGTGQGPAHEVPT